MVEYLPEYGCPVRWLSILSFGPTSEINLSLFPIQYLEQFVLPVAAVSMRRRRPIGPLFSQCCASARVTALLGKFPWKKFHGEKVPWNVPNLVQISFVSRCPATYLA